MRFRPIRALRAALEEVQRRLERLESAPPPTDPTDAIAAALKPLLRRIDWLVEQLSKTQNAVADQAEQAQKFTHALAEGIERTDRAERRIKATIARARKELRARGYDDPGLDAEAHEFRDADGRGGEESGVLPLPTDVGGDGEPASSVPGVSLRLLQRARGIG